jgi:hypothetical protein
MVSGLVLVTRTPKPEHADWTAPLSSRLVDWHSPFDSEFYTKYVRTVHAKVFVEATELGDVLATASLPYTQGVETPLETSLTTDDGITQSAVFTFFAELLGEAPSAPDPAPPGNAWTSSGAAPYWGAAPEGACWWVVHKER